MSRKRSCLADFGSAASKLVLRRGRPRSNRRHAWHAPKLMSIGNERLSVINDDAATGWQGRPCGEIGIDSI